MGRKPAIMIPCYNLIEYQLLPCAFLLLMDKVGLGTDQTAKEHHEQLDVFLAEWASFTPQHQTAFLNRLARIMQHGASLELAQLTVPELARAQLLKELHTVPAHAGN